MPTLEEQIAALNEQLNSQQAPVLPTLPRGTPDDGTRPGLLGRIGEVLAGGQSPTYRLGGREADAAGSRALLNFGLNMLMASGPARVRPDLLSAAATGLQGAQQSMDLDQRRAAAVAQQDYQQRMDLAKLGVEQNRDRIERMKAGLSLLQLQNRPVINADGSVSTAGATGGGGAGGGAGTAARQFTGDLEKDRQLIKGWESGGDPTALNYVAKADPTARARGATASGLYGFIDSTWKEGLKMIGGDPAKYPTAASAPPAVQDDVFTAVYKARGTAPWDPSKWGQNWVKNAAGGYDLVKTGTGGTATPPPYKVATTGTTPPPPTQPPAATPAVAGAPAAPPPAPGATPPAVTAAPGATPPTVPGATPPAPVAAPPTTGPLAGLPKIDDFVAQNMAKPTPEEEAMWRTPMSPEEEQNLRDGMKRLQSSVDAARASYNAAGSKDSEGAYHSAQKAYGDAEAELAKRQREALKVGDDRKAKWYEGERGRLKDLYGELVKGNVQLRQSQETSLLETKRKILEPINAKAETGVALVRDAQTLELFARQMGPANALWGTDFGKQLTNWVATYGGPGSQAVKEAAARQSWDAVIAGLFGDVRVPGSGGQSNKEGEWMMNQWGSSSQSPLDRMTQVAIIRKTAEARIADGADANRLHETNKPISDINDIRAKRQVFDRPPVADVPKSQDTWQQVYQYNAQHPMGEPYVTWAPTAGGSGRMVWARNTGDPNKPLEIMPNVDVSR
jgi:hypothetical protein